MNLKWILIIAAEFLALFYVFHLLDLIDLKTFVTLGVIEIMAGVLGYYLGRWGKSKDEELENKNKKREKLNGYIHGNNRILIETVIKDLYSKQKLFSSAKQQHAIEHLQTGYPDIWKLWFEDCKALKNQISVEEDKVKEYAKHKSYLKLEDIIKSGYYFLEQDNVTLNSLINGFDIIIDLLGDFPDISNENYKEIIETIMKDEPLYEMFKRLKVVKQCHKEKINEFKHGLEKIVYDFEERHIELDGSCELCKDWHEELESLK